MTTAWRLDEWADAEVLSRAPGPDVPAALRLATELDPVARALGERPWRYLSVLATLGAADLTAARTAEPHLDARAILAQAGSPDLARVGADAESTFGVFAANAPQAALRADDGPDGHPVVSGTKPWCSLAGTLSHALVTVGAPGRPELHAVPLRHPGAEVEPTPWVPRGLSAVQTSTLRLTEVPSVRVGPPGWYLDRPGFGWGGIGVAAVWFGAAAALAGALVAAARRREPDQVALVHLGHADRALHPALLALRDAAAVIGDPAHRCDATVLAARVRAVVADAAEQVLTVVGHALGPGPLTHDEEHARRVADLTVYLRQHHAERDLARLGQLCLGAVPDPPPRPA